MIIYYIYAIQLTNIASNLEHHHGFIKFSEIFILIIELKFHHATRLILKCSPNRKSPTVLICPKYFH